MRDRFIERKSLQEFIALGEKDPKWKELRDLPVPDRFSWIWDKFLQIWFNCEHDFNGNVIFTHKTINDYVECMKVPLSVDDKKMLFKIKTWVANKIFEMDKEE